MKKFILIIVLLLGSIAYSQTRITLNAYQDMKLLFQDDNYGNTAPTLDLIIKSEWQNGQRNIGYIFAYPQFEVAKLAGGTYYRYSGGAGYTFNTFLKNFDISPSVNWGIISRWGFLYYSWEFQGDISYKIYKGLRITILGTYTQRSEIHIWRFNSYVGLKYLFGYKK